MKWIPPGRGIGRKISDPFNQGLEREEDAATLIIRLCVERMVQEVLEQKVTDCPERERTQCRYQGRSTVATAMTTIRDPSARPKAQPWSTFRRCEARPKPTLALRQAGVVPG